MNIPTTHEVIAHVAEHYNLPLASVLKVFRTPTHPATMRDDFAGRAMAALITNPASGAFTYETRARIAYLQADGMLQERTAPIGETRPRNPTPTAQSIWKQEDLRAAIDAVLASAGLLESRYMLADELVRAVEGFTK